MKDFILSDDLERCKPWIEDALEYCNGTHEFNDIVLGIAESRMQLWAAPRGCIVTEIVVYPQKKVLNLFLAGETTRLGWKKALAPLGWKFINAQYGLEV